MSGSPRWPSGDTIDDFGFNNLGNFQNMKTSGSDGLRLGRFLAMFLAVTIRWGTPANASDPTSIASASERISYAGGGNDSGWVPFEIVEGHIFLRARVNGHEVPALLDSGASVIVINAPDALGLGVSATGSETGNGVQGSAASAMARGVSVAVGNLEIRSDRIAVPDISGIVKALHRPVTVVIGGEFFQDAAVRIDFSHRRLQFRKPSTVAVLTTAQVVGLHEDDGVRLVDVLVEGHPGKMLFDLGNGGAMILRSAFWSKYGLLKGRGVSMGQIQGYAGGGWNRRVMARTLRIGGTTFRDVPTDLTEDRNASSKSDGNIGLPVWSRFDLVVDFPHDRMILTSPTDAQSPFPVDHVGLKVRQTGMGAVIERVVPGSPAALAHLRQGDVIKSITDLRQGARLQLDGDWAISPTGRTLLFALSGDRAAQVTTRRYF